MLFILQSEGDLMKIFDLLSKEQLMKLKQINAPRKKKRREKPPKEKLSRKDWEEIMGTNRDIYKRVRGAIRRK